MNPTTTFWSVYSATGVPVWLVVAGLALALWGTQIWLRRECRARKNWAAHLLPWTITIVLLLAAMVLWRPVVTRTSTWQNDAEIVVVTDPTLSMQLPVGPQGITAQLDLAAVWDAAAITGRNLSARTLRDRLVTTRDHTGPLATGLERLSGEIAQAVPIGSETTRRLEQYRALRETAPAEISTGVTALQSLLQGPGAVGSAESRQDIGTALAALEKAVTSLPETPAPDSLISAEPVNALLPALTALNHTIDICLPLLAQLQETADRTFAAANKDRLASVLALTAKRTRTDLAAKAAEGLPAGTLVFKPTGERDQTDLYEQIEQALASRQGHVVSHCVIFSDGAQNGALTSKLPAQLKKAGIQLITVGTGLPGQVVKNVVILDWQLPRVLRAEQLARLRADVKAAPGITFTATLFNGDQTLATIETVAGPAGVTPVTLDFKAPATGRHNLRLTVTSPADPNPVNNSILIQVDSTGREPRLLLVGRVPDWDTAWFSLAAERAGCNLTQVFTADEAPKRGGLSRAIPSSLLQWNRYRAVMLHGPAFAGFSEQDVSDLYQFVSEKGGTLFLFANDAAGCGTPLGARFGWNQTPQRLEAPIRLAATAAHLPCLRLGSDGPQSARRFAALGSPAVFQVPPQDIVLVETARGEPVCSLGFYGRGKVIQWGIQDLSRMREFDNASVVDRLLDGMLGELAAPLFPEGQEASLALYPPLPQAGRPGLAILPSLPEKPAPAALNFAGQEIAATRTNHANAQFPLMPQGTATTLSVGDQKIQATISDNPGVEILAADFNETFLRDLATAAGGEYVPALAARQSLAAISPQTYTTKTATSWQPGSSPALLVGLILVAALHWILRKLAGLVI